MNNVFQNIEGIKSNLPKNKKITLVGGCFDLIHVGHIHLLEYAASLGNILVVAVISDNYAKKYKDLQRPVINQSQRARMVGSIRFVNLVYVSDVSTSSVETLGVIRPNSIVFGLEPGNSIKMQERIKNIESFSPSTKVYFLPRYTKEDISTSKIIDSIRMITNT